jgi:transcriptional regulator with XRE-family HTH domain
MRAKLLSASTVVAALEAARKRQGWTYHALAQASLIPASTLCDTFTGKAKSPSFDVLVKAGITLGFTFYLEPTH